MSSRSHLHPIVAQMAPSPEQEPAIRERDRDVVVTAGAGSGKTRTLVARYLALLAEGCPLRGAIAITFTEKAAREMRNRVRDEIRRYLETPDLPEVERERWQDLYSALDAARIGTIHGLCSEILHSHPAEAAVDPRFDVLDEGQAVLLQRQAVDETMAWVADDPTLVPLFELLGERGLRDALGTLLERRLDAAVAFSRLPGDVLAHWGAVLQARQSEMLAELFAGPSWTRAAATVCGAAALDAGDLMEIQRRTAATVLFEAEAPNNLGKRLEALAPLNEIRLQGGSARLWPGGKEQLDQVRGALKLLREAWREANLLHLTLTPQDEALAAAMRALRACFDFLCERYKGLKQQREALDFDDLEAGALALLETDGAVRARWQAEATAILVDEFQDTNDRQRRLVHSLSNGPGPAGCRGGLFIVGDAKQSIYRFRGADVAVFRGERARIARAGGAVLPLDTSYRAHRELLELLNELLRPVLGQDADPERPWREPFARLLPSQQAAGPGFTPPHVELHLALGPKSDGGLDRAAGALVARLVALVEDQAVFIEEGHGVRALNYGDIAILCRASTSFSAYEDALERAGIPFLTVAGRGFYGRPEVRDLLNALAALADPTDDLALAGLLRSPALALSDAALYGLVAAGRGGTFPDEITAVGSSPSADIVAVNTSTRRNASPLRLWDILRDFGPRLPGEQGARAARAATLISKLQAQAGRAPVADLIKAFLDATGYRAALIATGQTRAARNIGKLLADAHASGLVSVGDFLEYAAELRDSGAREGEARASAEGAVQIMSVHAAKGLEFPIVVLGDVTYTPPSRNDILFDEALGVLLPRRDDDKTLPTAYRLGKMVADDQEAAESDRLLYVAATRAREKLILSGCISVKSDGTFGAQRGWLQRLIETGAIELAGRRVVVEEACVEPMHLDLSVGGFPLSCAMYGPAWAGETRMKATTSPSETVMPLPPPLLAPVSAEPARADDRTADRERDPGQRVWRVVPARKTTRAPSWVVGKLVHEALAAWRFPGADGGFERWAVSRARSYGLTDPGQLANAERETRILLLRFREHPLYREMAGAGRRVHEVPYSRIAEDGQVESGIIDALYVRDGAWTIVEFKTDHIVERAKIEALLHEKGYLPQAERYQAAIAQLAGRRPALVFCFLDCGGAVQVHRRI